ncbi:hypothetical protein HAX54_045661 [Datura stramonium]|uniref:Uncharacterized protein n=1 Tax=Datura stramonium TaxID=4076 RepID=A0ABS8RPI0_DATST|nr:hypothetical protein [Datura stramonium]
MANRNLSRTVMNSKSPIDCTRKDEEESPNSDEFTISGRNWQIVEQFNSNVFVEFPCSRNLITTRILKPDVGNSTLLIWVPGLWLRLEWRGFASKMMLFYVIRSNTMIRDDDDAGEIDFSKWRKFYSRDFGISNSMIPAGNSMIPASAYDCLKVLQSGDKKSLYQAIIVGRTFPHYVEYTSMVLLWRLVLLYAIDLL